MSARSWTSQKSLYTALATVEDMLAGWDYFRHYEALRNYEAVTKPYQIFEVNCEQFTNVYSIASYSFVIQSVKEDG
jgi:enoyl-[acyl-carrier-protein] reductase (NADH)